MAGSPRARNTLTCPIKTFLKIFARKQDRVCAQPHLCPPTTVIQQCVQGFSFFPIPTQFCHYWAYRTASSISRSVRPFCLMHRYYSRRQQHLVPCICGGALETSPDLATVQPRHYVHRWISFACHVWCVLRGRWDTVLLPCLEAGTSSGFYPACFPRPSSSQEFCLFDVDVPLSSTSHAHPMRYPCHCPDRRRLPHLSRWDAEPSNTRDDTVNEHSERGSASPVPSRRCSGLHSPVPACRNLESILLMLVFSIELISNWWRSKQTPQVTHVLIIILVLRHFSISFLRELLSGLRAFFVLFL